MLLSSAAVVSCVPLPFAFHVQRLVPYPSSTQVMTSEYFNTAGRSVKTGLSASVIVSQWTWSATLRTSWDFFVLLVAARLVVVEHTRAARTAAPLLRRFLCQLVLF